MIRAKLYTGFILFAFFAMIGCGNSSEEPLENIDLDPPHISLRSPWNNTKDVPIGTTVNVSFSELMDETTINDSSFFITDEDGVAVLGTISNNDLAFVFTPASNLVCGETYTVTITTDIQDSSGNSLEETIIWSFTTINKPGFTTPKTLDASDLTDTSVVLNGLFSNPDTFTTSVWFEYGLTESYGYSTIVESYANIAEIQYVRTISDLNERTVYHYRVVTENQDGVFYGNDRTFRTYQSPRVLASELDAPADLLLRDNDLYWIEIYGNTINKVSINDRVTTQLITTEIDGNSGFLLMDNDSFYWGDCYNIWTKLIDEGEVVPLYENNDETPDISAQYLSENYLYYSNRSDIQRISLADHSSLTLGLSSSIDDFIMDDDCIYWSNYTGGIIYKANQDGSSITVLAMNLDYPKNLLVDSGQLYWSESDSIKSMSTSGGEISVIANNVSPKSIAKDQTKIYFGDESAIKSVNLSTGEIIGLAPCKSPYNLIVDMSYVYWIESGSRYSLPLGEIHRCLKMY